MSNKNIIKRKKFGFKKEYLVIIFLGEVNMKFSVWQDEEVRNLFKVVEECKSQNRPLKEAFAKHAQKYHRKQNSVRNYYYSEVDNLEKDEERRKKLQINLQNHLKNKLIPFSKFQEEEFLKKVEEMKKQGLSVRSICIKLSGGDMTLMTRLQNKFQNLKREKGKVDNIIKFQKKQKNLTDNDINSLFFGLVKLIKKNAQEECSLRFKEEKENSAFLLKEAYNELNMKTKELKTLKENYEILKKENLSLLEKMSKTLDAKNQKLKEKFKNFGGNVDKIKA